ncbi:MAG: PQQ-binding-like beta-propeller repeat protein [Myxococcales bacterium]|nr:PQQ-binding-like beta-propeller repeat protein [Myxococcales bacterium]
MRPQRSHRPAFVSAALAAAFGVLGAASESHAQVDVRLIRPNIMVLLDTSGSMEWNATTQDSTNACSNAPDGAACNRCPSNPAVSICAPGCTDNRTRWSTALEVLTGSIQNYSCVEQARNDTTAADLLYPIPHHLPLSNGVPLFRSGAQQFNDGILDVYADRVRFGLMTFDNNEGLGTSAYDGMYSYARNSTYTLNYVGCPSRPINNGARRPSADNNTADIVPGGLRSVGSPAADTATLALLNQQIQESLVGRRANMSTPEIAGLRPFGGTPIAGMLEDAFTYWTTHGDVIDGSGGGSGDPFFRCRTRANILITDGHPNEDYRRHADTPSSTITCEGAVCPYDLPSATAMRMAMSGGSNPGARTYVVAFNANDAITRQELEPIALAGATDRVYYANDRPSLASALSSVIDTVSSVSSTRTPPVLGEAGTTAQEGTTQYRFNASFQVRPGYPWGGSLVRTRTACVAPGMGQAPVPTEVTPAQNANDDFAYNLRATVRSSQGLRPQRYLWTYIPTTAVNANDLRQPIRNAQGPGMGTAVELTNVAPVYYNAGSTSERDTLVSWLRGDPGTNRETQPLGDIYRSTPTFVPAPRVNLADQTFTAYRQRALPQAVAYGRARGGPITVGTREPVMYVGTNDGILHAFNADTGEEIWGFVPPYLMATLRSAYPNVRSMGVDGTPVVKEIYYERSQSTLADDSAWRTVMVVGLRSGGGAYEALDVTDPYNPKFLWQYTDATINQAAGQAAIGTLYFSRTMGAQPVERAVAILPGGPGTLASSCSAGANPRPLRANTLLNGWTSGRGARRNSVRCWNNSPVATGQWLHIVDLQTGDTIRRLGAGTTGNDPTGSPLVGSPALFNGQAGVVSTRAYVGDADGMVWRADLTASEPRFWWLGEAYDAFWDRPYNEGRPVLERPVTTTDAQNNVVVAFGTGDSETLETLEDNRVVSFTERVTTSTSGQATGVNIESNWEIRTGTNTAERDFFSGERVTGALTLFNGSLYFGTFIPRTSTDACQIGRARLWGVDIAAQDPNGSFTPRGAIDRPTGCAGPMGSTYDRVTENFDGDLGCTADGENTLLFGVTLQRPASCSVVTSSTDPLTGIPRSFVSGTNSTEYRIVLQTAQTSTGMGGTVTRSFTRSVRAPILPARVDSWATVFE